MTVAIDQELEETQQRIVELERITSQQIRSIEQAKAQIVALQRQIQATEFGLKQCREELEEARDRQLILLSFEDV